MHTAVVVWVIGSHESCAPVAAMRADAAAVGEHRLWGGGARTAELAGTDWTRTLRQHPRERRLSQRGIAMLLARIRLTWMQRCWMSGAYQGLGAIWLLHVSCADAGGAESVPCTCSIQRGRWSRVCLSLIHI